MNDSSSTALTATVLFAAIPLTIVIVSMIQVAIIHRRTAVRTTPLERPALVAIAQGRARYEALYAGYLGATRLKYGILIVAILLIAVGLALTSLDEEVGVAVISVSFPLLAVLGLYPVWLKLRLESYAGRLTPAEREISRHSL
ncbi:MULTISPECIES: hypothetical protein [unclassified Microbacterium]|uniref:hypothetical protein n=1 Tax=unclassified Microbacterium TaxID=2609290 RepID=UPI00288314C5|nr:MULTISPECIES: hypothetical protein [unclassified Microbacterium]